MDSVYFDKLPSGGGRPKLILNERGLKTVEDLAHIECTQDEIAAILGCERSTLTNENNRPLFEPAFKRGSDGGKASLRRKQYEVAMKGNCSMLIWLGKQYLGQSEKLDTNIGSDEESKKLAREYLDAIKKG